METDMSKKIADFLKQLSENGILVSLESEKLKIKSQHNDVPTEILEKLKAQKSDIVAFLLRYSGGNDSTSEFAITPVQRHPDEGYPLSFAQERMWTLNQLEGDEAVYSIHQAFTVSGDINLDHIETAIARIVERHEVLRTVIKNTPAGPRQFVKDDVKFHLNRQDLSHLSLQQQQQEVMLRIQEDATRPFDLKRDLMVRATFLSLNNGSQQQQGVLLICMHHIASDGVSGNLLVTEFAHHYQNLKTGQETELSLLPFQYLDFAVSQRHHFNEAQLQKKIDYWCQQLQDAPVLHTLPTDYERPVHASHKGAVYSGQLDKELSQNLHALALQQGVSMFMLFHAALSLLMARLGESDDIVIGTQLANRTNAKTQFLIGCFVNTIALRCQLDQNWTCAELLQQIRLINRDAQIHQDLPFATLVEKLNLSNNPTHNTLFQVELTLESEGDQAQSELQGIHIEPLDTEENTALFDFSLDVLLSQEQIKFNWIYNVSLFKEQTIKTFECYLTALLKAFVSSPDKPLSQIKMLSDDEIKSLLIGSNNSHETPELKADTLVDWWQKMSLAHPNKQAIVGPGGSLSYQVLEEKAHILAMHLVQVRNVTQGERVGVCMTTDVEFFIAMFAIFKAGAALVPLDPNSPIERITDIVTDSEMRLLISQSNVFGLEQLQDCEVLKLDPTFLPPVAVGKVSMPVVQGSDIAYVIYTSGTTGKPKGVLVEHQAICEHIAAIISYLGINENDRALQFTSAAFDAFYEQCFAVLFSAGTLCLRHQSLPGPAEFFELVKRYEVSITDLSPGYLEQLINGSEEGMWQKSGLRHIVIGGEAPAPELLKRWLQLTYSKQCALYNAYGPTEAVITSTIKKIDYSDIGSVQLGQPLGNRRLFIVDRYNNICPAGVPGELLIAGSPLAQGYLNLPQLSSDKFIDFEGAGKPAQRCYRSGDKVVQNCNGELTFVGRIDNQVKVRGYRVELTEIENKLTMYKGISSALVQLVTTKESSTQGSNSQLVAWLITESEKQVYVGELARQLKIFLKSNLPDYMIPKAFVFMSKWPLTLSGKIDIEALPQPDMLALQTGYVCPCNDIEAQLVGIFAQLLKIDSSKMSVTESYFELGVQSLMAIQLTVAINKAFHIQLDVRKLFENTTVRELSSVISDLLMHQYLVNNLENMNKEELDEVEL